MIVKNQEGSSGPKVKSTLGELTIFANFFINTEERFLRMKDSFKSMSKITVDYWVINIRGMYSDEAILFFNSNLDNVFLFSLDSGNWFYDSLQISVHIRTKYILTWLEDTICLNPIAVNQTVSEMSKNDVDILNVTYWCDGHMKRSYQHVTDMHYGTNIDFFDHTTKNNCEVQKKSTTYGHILLVICVLHIKTYLRKYC